jgi:hypothetical protein
MSAVAALWGLAAASLMWAVVSALRITAALERRGLHTPWPLLRLFVLRNLGRYRDVTRRETGQVGGLFYSYVVSINAAWILGLAGWLVKGRG